MNRKKILSAVMAAAMAMSMAVPAFADDPVDPNSTVVQGTYAAPEISVTVPTAAVATINPYKLPIKFGMKADASVAGTGDTPVDTIEVTGSAIASQPMVLLNLGSTDLDVYASAIATVPTTSGVKFSESKTEVTATGDAALTSKTIYMVVEGAPITLTATEIDTTTATLGQWKEGIKAKWDAVSWTGAGSTAAITTKAGTAEKLGKVVKVTTNSQGDITGFGAGLAVRLNGEAVESPKEAWAATDTFTTTIAYTFKPAATTSGGSGS